MKYNKIFIYAIILLTKNIFCYDTKNLNDFLYGSSQTHYVSKNFTTKIFSEPAQIRFENRCFVGCRLSFCSFNHFTLSNTTFDNSNFFNAYFVGMDLSTTVFYGCVMHKSKFINCNLKGTRFILCRGLLESQKLEIERKGGAVIDQIIGIKSKEEYWEKIIECQQKGLYDRIMIYEKGPSLLSKIKNKINNMYNASMQKTRKKIQNIYNY